MAICGEPQVLRGSTEGRSAHPGRPTVLMTLRSWRPGRAGRRRLWRIRRAAHGDGRADAPGGQAGTSSLSRTTWDSDPDRAEQTWPGAQPPRPGASEWKSSPTGGVQPPGRRSYRILTLSDGSQISSHAVVLPSGWNYRKLNVPGVEELTGRGVFTARPHRRPASAMARCVLRRGRELSRPGCHDLANSPQGIPAGAR
jgi:hypothetical protein